MMALVTAYCLTGITATGTHARPGIAAVDPQFIPLGSRIVVNGRRYRAEDTGFYVQGRHIDLWMPCHQAVQYGARRMKVVVKR